MRPDKCVPTSQGRIYRCISLRTVSENSTYYDDLGYFAVNLINTTHDVDLNTAGVEQRVFV